MLYIVCSWLIFFITCCTNPTEAKTDSSKDNVQKDAQYYLERLEEANRYYVFITNADADTNTVVLCLNGGPTTNLDTNYFKELHSHFNVAYVHQVQTLEPDIYQNNDTLNSFGFSKEAGVISASYVYHVIRHFKDQKKIVYITSHSFGSFIYPKTIEVFGNIADRVVMVAGRLDIPKTIWTAFLDGFGALFGTDGITKIILTDHVTNVYKDNGISEWNGTRLQAGLGYHRYTDTLNGTHLGSFTNTNIMYVTGWLDEAVGRLSDEEIHFLHSKYVKVVEVTGSGHVIEEVFKTDPFLGLIFFTNN